MKKLLLLIVIVFCLSSCLEKGETKQRLNGDENTLPNELKGVKVYNLGVGDGDMIYVGLLNGYSSVSTQWRSGKYTYNAILFQKNNSVQNIEISEIISINDSIIVAKLKK